MNKMKCPHAIPGDEFSLAKCGNDGGIPAPSSFEMPKNYRPTMFLYSCVGDAINDVRYRVEKYHPDVRNEFIEQLIDRLRNGEWTQ